MRKTTLIELTQRWSGLYIITDSNLLAPDQLLASVTHTLRAGAALVQYRDKSTDAPRRLREARALVQLCRSQRVPLIINDDVALARASGADGVHLGHDDASVSAARAVLGEQAIIGVSCYSSLTRAVQAEAEGADYIAFGRFFASSSKPGLPTASLDLLRRAKASLQLPLVAIGGITPDNGGPLLHAGADLLAVIHGVFGQADPYSAARQYLQLFSQRT